MDGPGQILCSVMVGSTDPAPASFLQVWGGPRPSSHNDPVDGIFANQTPEIENGNGYGTGTHLHCHFSWFANIPSTGSNKQTNKQTNNKQTNKEYSYGKFLLTKSPLI